MVRYNPEIGQDFQDDKSSQPKRAGLMAKAALFLAGTAGAGLGVGLGVGHEVGFQRGRAMGHKEADNIEQIQPPIDSAPEVKAQQEEVAGESEDSEKEEIYLNPTILSKEIVEQDGHNYIKVSATVNGRGYSVVALISIKPGSIDGDLEQIERSIKLSESSDKEIPYDVIAAFDANGNMSMVAMTEISDGLQVIVIETDKDGNVINKAETVVAPDPEGPPLPHIDNA